VFKILAPLTVNLIGVNLTLTVNKFKGENKVRNEQLFIIYVKKISG